MKADVSRTDCGWGGFVLPKETADEYKKVLADALKEAVESDDFKKFASERGMSAVYKSPEDFTAFAEQQFKFFSDFIPTLDLK